MISCNSKSGLVLNGINGANPLGFLAAIGTAVVAQSFCPTVKIAWCEEAGFWRPILDGVSEERELFVEQMMLALTHASIKAFEIDRKLPFAVDAFRLALLDAQSTITIKDRRLADFLAAFGSEMYPGKDKGVFQDSKFRMVRSGDSAGQGLPVYAQSIRKTTTSEALKRTLFCEWDYSDVGFSLRWDPVEDQRYALRWRDPSKSGVGQGLGTMLGANCLALEALQLFPVMWKSDYLATTGFNQEKKTFFSWPIWVGPITLNVVRSLLALGELHSQRALDREKLGRMGIVELYRSQRIAQGQYYNNFAPAVAA